MKKLITILFLVTFSLQAQDSIRFAGINTTTDKLDHAAVGYALGITTNIVSYKLLSLTRLDPELSKLFSFAFGAAVPILAGHLKERYDEKNGGQYSKEDFNVTAVAGLCGSFTMRIMLWNSIPRSHVPEEETIYDSDVWDLDNIYINK